jgi:NAD(P)-dependent dehydrogenase (short-subunit alcohol dehydrogenase family)
MTHATPDASSLEPLAAARRAPAIVTGAAGALGAAVRARLAASGRPIAALVRRTDEADALRAAGTWARAVDLLDEADVADAVDDAVHDLGPPAGALLLAGGFAMAPAADADLRALRAQWDVNVGTAASVVRALVPVLRARGGGALVGVAAGQARRGGAKAAPYAAAKAALAAYLRAVDEELAPEGVRATVVFPMGTLDTDANRRAMPDADPTGWIDPAVLADVLVQALELGPRGRWREVEVFPDAR